MYKFILAIRYLVKRRISYFAILTAALCVFVSFSVITVLSGLTTELKEDAHAGIGDCVVSSRSLVGFAWCQEFVEKLRGCDLIKAAAPAIRAHGVVEVTSDRGQRKDNTYVLEIMGIDPVSYSQVTKFGQWLFAHKNDLQNAFQSSYEPNMPGCIPGARLLFKKDPNGGCKIEETRRRVKLEVSVFPLTAKGTAARGGLDEVNTKSFYYSDHIDSPDGYLNWHRLYLPFEEAQALCGMGSGQKRANAIFIKFKPGTRLGAGCAQVRKTWEEFAANKAPVAGADTLTGVRVQDWKTYSRYIVAVLETQQTFMIVIFAMIGIITVFIVFVVFYMIVCHKSKDIGILKSVGVSSRDVLSLFLYFAAIVGAAGSILGAISGLWFVRHIKQIDAWGHQHFDFHLVVSEARLEDVPAAIDIRVLGATILAAIGACLLGALLPSWQAARKQPVQTLQVNQL